MRTVIFLLFALILCTCGPAPDSCDDCTPAEAVARAEEIYHATLENLDPAVMERLLSENFTAVYPTQGTERDRAAYLDELGQMRLIFPELTISVDSSKITEYRGNYVVKGSRTFTWSNEAQKGSYREQFGHTWEKEPAGWRLLYSTITPFR